MVGWLVVNVVSCAAPECSRLHGIDDSSRSSHPPDPPAVSDAGIFACEVLEARAVKEAAAVATWQRNTASLHTMADLHAWLFATHLCYSVSRQHEFGREQDLDPRLAASY